MSVNISNNQKVKTPALGAQYNLIRPKELMLEPTQFARKTERELLSKTLYTAVSPGTELAAFTGVKSLSGNYVYPRKQGYCNVSRILEVGQNISDYAVGDLILTFGSHQSHLVLSEEDVLYRLQPADVPKNVACSYLYHLGYNAVLKSNVKPGSKVAVIGLGVLGLTSVEMSVISGGQVLAISDLNYHAEIARLSGAQHSINRSSVSDDNVYYNMYDVVILTTDNWSDFELAQKLCRSHGVIACLGFPGRSSAPGNFNPLDSKYFYYKQLSIIAVGFSPKMEDARGFCRFNEVSNLDYINYLMRNRKLNVKSLITEVYEASNLTQVYERLVNRNENDITFVLSW